MFKLFLFLLLGIVIGAEAVHIVAHKDMEKDPHSHCSSRYPELRD
tara:strand:+ start:2423 stop:2557 length:135 start_codon:yes stop_codon:yes gene_type:complete